METQPRPRIVRLPEGRALPGVIFKVMSAEAGGAFSIVEHPYQPRILITPHVHARVDQVTYVLEGQLGIRVGDTVFDAEVGSYVVKPHGIPHTHWNPTDAPARVMEISAPGDFERFFEEMADAMAAGDRAKLVEVGRRHDTEFVLDWVPELKARYGVKLMGE